MIDPSIINNRAKCIELYCVIMQEYLHKITKSIVLNKLDPDIHHIGWKIVSHVFRVFYYKTQDIKEIYKFAKDAYIIYLEYIEQTNSIDPTKEIDFKNVMTYIYKKLFGENNFYIETGSQPVNVTNDLFDQMTIFTEVVVLWKTKSFSMEQRETLVNDYLQSYLLLFCDSTKQNLHTVLELLLEKNINDLSYELHSIFLKELYLYIESYSNRDFTKEYVNELCLVRYYSNREDFHATFESLRKKKDMRGFLKWYFSIC